MSRAQYDLYCSRSKQLSLMPGLPAGDDLPPEKLIQRRIIEYCRSQNWLCCAGAMHLPTARPPGEPDMYIWIPGRIVPVEVKTSRGKLSPEQVVFHHLASKLGHQILVVRSLQEFIEAINGILRCSNAPDGGKVDLCQEKVPPG